MKSDAYVESGVPVIRGTNLLAVRNFQVIGFLFQNS
jgi:hypothetical protein